MGKKHQKHQAPPSDSSADSLEKQAEDEMQAGRFRKARDLYKVLCKQDRAKYLQGLIDANRSLAAQLMDKGQAPEAQQVIAYLKTIAPASELSGLELEAALNAKEWGRAFECALGILKQTGGRADGRLDDLIADTLVLSFADDQTSAQLPEPFKAELNIITEALRGIAKKRCEQVQELIRPLPRASVFAHWKMLIKGMLAFYGGDAAKAKALFELLPTGGTTGRAAQAFGPFLGGSNSKQGSASIAASCQILDVPEISPVLSRAEDAWKKGHFIESYKEMRTARGFPSQKPSLLGALSDFYMKAGTGMNPSAYWNYMGFFEKLSDQKELKNKDEGWFVYRTLMVEMKRDIEDAPLDFLCAEFVERMPESDPLKPKMASMVLEHAGDYFAEKEVPGLFQPFRRTEILRDGPKAIKLLKESIKWDRSNLSAHLQLLDVYEAENLKSERNRLLDEMTSLFPRSKEVMLRAGRECIARKTWVKGLDYLQSAYELDRLDPQIATELAGSLAKMAQQNYEKGAFPKARQIFERAYQHAIPNKVNFDRGLGFLKARQAVLELEFDEASIGERLLEEARVESGSVPALLFFARYYYQSLVRKKKQKRALPESLVKGPPPANASERKNLLLALDYAKSFNERAVFYDETEQIIKYLQPITKEAFTEEEALDLIPFLAPKFDFEFTAKALIKAGLKRDPKHPRFRFYKISNETMGFFDGRLKELHEIQEEATKRGDSGTLKLVAKAIDSTRRSGEDDDSWDSEDDNDDGGSMPSMKGLDGIFPPDFEEMKQKVKEMNDAEFEEFRNKAIKIMPAPIFELFFAGIQRPAKERASKASPSSDPNQQELF